MVPPEDLTTNPISPAPKQPTRRKLSGSLLALGGAAVVSVYTVGYASSQSSIDDLASQLDVPAPAVTSAPANNTPSARSAGSRPTATPSPPTNARRSNVWRSSLRPI